MAERRRRVLAGVAAALAILLIGEVGARALAPRLPEPLLWHSEEAQRRVEQMDALGHADVVVAGSSIVAYGVDPVRLEAGLPDRPTVYNAGLTAGVPLLTQPWVTQVVLPRLQPDLLVVGLHSFDLSDHEAGLTFRDAFVASIEGRSLMSPGDRLHGASRWAARHSWLWRHRTTLRQPATLARAVAGRPPPEPAAEVAAIRPDGRTTHLEDEVFDPDASTGPGVPVGGWSLGTASPEALAATVEQARAANVEVVLVAMPVTDAYVSRHPGGEDDHRAFVDALERLGASTGTPVLRYDMLRDPALFLDEVHLNRAGATALSERLATDLGAVLRTGSR